MTEVTPECASHQQLLLLDFPRPRRPPAIACPPGLPPAFQLHTYSTNLLYKILHIYRYSTNLLIYLTKLRLKSRYYKLLQTAVVIN